MSGFFAPSSALATTTVNPVGNGTNISIDTTSDSGCSGGACGTYKTLAGPSFGTENGDIATGTHSINLPDGWEFDITSAITIVAFNDIDFQSTSITPDSTSFSFEVTTQSTTAGSIGFSGIKVRPTDTNPSTNNMTYSGDGIVGVDGSTNFGTLTSVPGAVTQLIFETQPTETVYGSTIASFTVKTQDQFGNDSTSGLAATETVTLSLNGSGTLEGTFAQNIGTGGGNGTATFSDLAVDSVGTGNMLTATPNTYAPVVSSSFDITPLPITVTATAGQTKVYGQTDPEFAYTVTSGALVNDDSFTGVLSRAEGDAVANYAINQGTLSAGANYALTFVPDNFSITAKNLTISGTTADNKIYDGNNVATLDFTDASLVGVEAGDTGNVTINPSSALGTFSGVDVATGQTVTVTGVTLSGSAAGNYTVSQPAPSADITPRPLTVTATGVDREYDGTTNATVTLSSDKITGDDVTLAYTTALFGDKTAGDGKTVSVSGINISGTKSGNYALQNTEAVTTANITKKPITATINVDNKTYDGDTSATYSDTNPRVAVGVIGGDTVVIENTGTKAFTDKNVSIGKTVNATGLTLSGADAGNYEFDGAGAGVATINARPVTITAVTGTKTYNGTTVSSGTPIITNTGELTTGPIMGSDVANFTQSYDNENVGTGKTLTPSGSVDDSNGGNNYAVTPVPVLTGEITQAPLTATVEVEKKVVNGSDEATITGVSFVGIVGGEILTADFSGATASFANADVGIGKAVTASDIAIASGNELGNYSYDGNATGKGDILAVPTTVYVDDNWVGTGDWTDPDGTGGPATYFGYDAFATIQEAITAVNIGGTVNVAAGTYVEDLAISKSITLQGADKITTIIKGVATDAQGSFPDANNSTNIDIQANDVTVSGFTIESPNAADGFYSSGIVLTGTSIEISSNKFVIIQAGVSPAVNDSNTSVAIQTYSKAAIPTSDISGLIIADNSFEGTPAKGYYGIYLNPDVGAGMATISGNTLTGYIWRAITTERSNTAISGNTVTNTDTGNAWGNTGIRIVDWGNATIDSVSVTDNIITGNNGLNAGVMFGFSGATHALTNIQVTDNTITGNDTGVVVHISADEVALNGNSIQDNTLNVDNTDDVELDATNNYWGTAVAGTIDGKISGSVDFEPYYVDSAKTILSSTVPSVVYVDDGYTDGASGSYYFGYNAFSTIQDGINAVATGGTVNVAAGTYDITSNPGITVDKSVTINGASADTTTVTGRNKNGSVVNGSDVLFNVTANNVTIKNLTIDLGDSDSDYDVGVFTANSGGINNLTVQNNTLLFAASGNSIGEQLIHLGGGSGAIVSGNTLETASGNSGLYVGDGANTSLTVSGNTVTPQPVVSAPDAAGANDTDGGGTFFNQMAPVTNSVISNNNFTDTGIAIYLGAGSSNTDTITVSGNTFTSNNGHSSGLYGAIAITSEVDGVNTQNITITGNTFTGSQVAAAITIFDSVNATVPNVIGSTITINNNKFNGDNFGGINIGDGVSDSIDASKNWWGAATGPTIASNSTGTGDEIVGTVDYRPWCTNEACSSIDTISPVVTVDSLLTNDTTPTITGTIVESNSVTITVTVNGNPYTAVVTGGTWSADVTDILPANTYDVSVSAEDLAGNIGTDNTTNELIVDTVAPTLSTVTIASDNDDATLAKVGDTVTLTVVANENIQSPFVTIATNSANVVAGIDAQHWTATYVMASGDAEDVIPFIVNFSDIAGNAGAQVIATIGGSSVTFDKTAPVVALTSIAGNNYINNSEKGAIHVVGTVEAGSVINVSLTSGVTVSGTGTATDGNFDIIIDGATLSDGTVTPSVTATDATGNVSVAVITPTAIKDVSAPSVTSKTPGAGAVGIDPAGNITVVFSEDVVITNAEVTLQKGSSPAVSTAVDFVSGTKTATIDPAATLENNSKYTVTLEGVTDTVGNPLPTTTWVFTTSASYSMTLTIGWNLISLPVVPTDTAASAVLGSALNDALKIETIWKYDPVAGEWGAYHPGNSETSNFSTMTAGEGYWINYLSSSPGTIAGTGNLFQEGNSTPPQKTLAAGWNLIGYYQLENVTNTTAAKALSTVSGQWTQLRTYNNTDKQFQAITGVDYMKPGEGYWIFMKSSSYAPYLYGPGDTD